jgi:hypothetical protein
MTSYLIRLKFADDTSVMIVEAALVGSFSYVATYFMYFMYDKDQTPESVDPPVEKFVEMTVESTEYDPPVYITSSGLSVLGLGVPLGGGNRSEMRTVLNAAIHEDGKTPPLLNWEITDLKRGWPSARFWLNTPDDLSNYFKNQGIPTSVARLSLPLHVSEYKLPPATATYKMSSTYTIGSNAKLVARTAALARNIRPLPFRLAAAITVGTGSYLYFS